MIAAPLLLWWAAAAVDVDAVVARYVHHGGPGCAVSVARAGKIELAKGYGLASLEHGVPITARTAFYAGSVSKQFTAAAITLLANEGRIDLDAPVRRYVPELPEFPEGQPTVRHLLHHASGLRESFTLLDLAGWRYGDDVSTEDDIMALVRRMKALNFAPGSRYLYCNTGYILLARIVRLVSGQPFRDFVRTRIFEPAGMPDSRFRDDHFEVVPRLAMGYVVDKDTGRWRQAPAHVDTVGGGGLITTVEDLARWSSLPLPKGTLDAFKLTNGETLPYRRGIVAGEYRGVRTIGHGGALAGYRAQVLRAPDDDLAVSVLCNAVIETEPLAMGMLELWLNHRMGAAITPAPAPRLNAVAVAPILDPTPFAGRYYSEELDVEFTVAVRNRRVVIQRPRNREQVADWAGPNRVRLEGLGVLEFDAAGFRLSDPRVLNLRFVKRR
ncbi:MAG: beta-lactamase family protein [Bryobacterales bacterium]|nr:beta-lactamase family protein [Bryobacterales bacterium]